jgi:hypothetical protein
MTTVDGTELYRDAIIKIRRYENALRNIADLWPMDTTAKLNPEWLGENGGKSRAIIAEGAVTIARKALGIERMP